jgi:r-opsin
MCELYAMAGSMFGCGDIWTMVFIAMDRYNVIVKVCLFIADYFCAQQYSKNLQGLAGKPMTTGTALLRIAFVWIFATAWTLAPLFGWNRLT